MNIHNYLNIQVLKVCAFLVIIGCNNSIVYGQDIMEEAIVTVSFSEKDNTKTIIAKAIDQTGLPIEDLELYFYVQRTFSLLPIGDAFNVTDENGLLEIEFPNNLPGDHQGNIILVVKIIESDIYNDLTIEKTKNWGVPVKSVDPKIEKRSLWAAAANAPISLIIIISAMIITVWYIICYIIYKLFRISRIEPISH